MRRLQLLALASMLAANPLLGQSSVQAAPDTAARRQAMERLSFLVGDWSGDATYRGAGGDSQTLRQTESVQWKLGRQMLLIEGIGRRLTGGEPADTAFNALATIDWLPDRGYAMRSTTLEGRQATFRLTLSDHGFTWGWEVAGGQVRYTMELTSEGEWHERGEFSRDGQQWLQFIEMRLRRECMGLGC